LGIGPNPQSPIPNPQSPIPNPQSTFYLSNNNISCKSKNFYNYKKSNNFKLIKKQSQNYYDLCYFSDSFLIEKIANSKNITSKFDNFEIILIGDLKQSLCLVFGTRLISYEEDLKRNFLYNLHKNNHINSYYFSYDINSRNNDELTYIFDIDINEITNNYAFIKTTSRSLNDTQDLVWGLYFDKIYLDNNILDEKQTRAEFNYNLGTLIGPSSFHDLFIKFLKKKLNNGNYHRI